MLTRLHDQRTGTLGIEFLDFLEIIDGLLAAFGLQRSDLDDEARVAAAVRGLAARMPTYITLKDVKKRWGHGQEDVFPVSQFEKLWGDMTAIPEITSSFLVVSRMRGQQLKEQAQLDSWLRDGSAAYVDGLKKAYAWDVSGRSGILPDEGGKLIAHEFDYKQDGGVVYEKDGVKITSFPAIHVLDGAVSYRLDWNGLSFVFGGDSAPNQWFIERSRGADFVIHECFPTPSLMVKFYGQAPTVAMRVATKIHTSPPAFGKIMSAVKPRHAIAYHFFNEEGTRYGIYDRVRETYDGPLSMATDNMVWNIRRDEIVERMAVWTEDAWSVPGLEPPPARTTPPTNMYSDWLLEGRWDVSDVEKAMLEDHANKYNIDLEKFQ